MGAKFSSNDDDAKMLVRDKYGQLVMYTGKMDDKLKCNPLPVPLVSQKVAPNEQRVQYLFFPGSDYQGKNLHVHTFYDDDCDTPASDEVRKETNLFGKKNVNYMKQERDSNSGYYEYNTDPINMPLYPKFKREEDGVVMSRHTKRSAYNNCTLIPYQAVKDTRKPVTVKHNGVLMKMYTDETCTDEYINILDPPKSINDHYNVDNRLAPIVDDDFTMKYTKIKSYIEPAITTNAKYYRTFRDQYPEGYEPSRIPTKKG
jgi:hypothetical protein